MTNALFLFDPDRDNVPVNSDESSTGWKLTLPPQVDTVQLYDKALARGVAYVAGSFFYTAMPCRPCD